MNKNSRASDDVLKQRKILTASLGGSVSPPPSQQRSVATSHLVSTPRSPFKAHGCTSEGRKIVRASRVRRPDNARVAPPTSSTSTVPCTERGSNKNLAPHGRRRIVRAARRKDVAPRPPLIAARKQTSPTTPPRPPPPPCETPPAPKSKKPIINEHQGTAKDLASCTPWEKSMKAALVYVAKTRSPNKKVIN